MQKQIIYPKFIPRLFSITIDLAILTIALTPIMNWIGQYIFIYIFADFFLEFNVDMSSNTALAASMAIPEFADYITLERTLKYSSALFIINTVFMGGYFVFFWSKFGATPGKMLMRISRSFYDICNGENKKNPRVNINYGDLTVLLRKSLQEN